MRKNRKYRTDFLFVNTSFLMGTGSVFNVAGNYFLFNSSDTPEQADMRALASDWEMIGSDIQRATKEIDKLIPETIKDDR